MPLTDQDRERLRHAARLAEGAIGLSEPNPRVGCVIHDAQGRAIGEGHTQHAGGPHAEVMALRAARSAGAELRGGTAWVTLEPCAHHGRTPPCCDALITAGLSRVVVACTDPFEAVAGQGIARLRAAGVQVDLLDGTLPADAALRREIQDLNIGFFSRVQRRRPWTRAKVAMSLDGQTALADGRSQWITGPEARSDGQRWRRRAGAVMTGAGTVRDDDPRLDVRDWPTQVQPLRVVLDSHHRLPLQARVHAPPGASLVVAATPPDAAREAAYAAAGVDCWVLPDRSSRAASETVSDSPQTAACARVDLAALWQRLAERGVNELHLEAGASLTGAAWTAGLIDEWLVYAAPKLLGPGRPMAAWAGVPSLEAVTPLRWLDATPVGGDLRLRLVVDGADAFLAA